jgi:hypothetical protein
MGTPVNKSPFQFGSTLDVHVDVAESKLQCRDAHSARKVLEDAVRTIPDATLNGLAQRGIRSFHVSVLA